MQFEGALNDQILRIECKTLIVYCRVRNKFIALADQQVSQDEGCYSIVCYILDYCQQCGMVPERTSLSHMLKALSNLTHVDTA